MLVKLQGLHLKEQYLIIEIVMLFMKTYCKKAQFQ